MVLKQEFIDWRQQEITAALLETLAEKANLAVTEVIRRQAVDIGRDQFLKGYIAGLDEAVSFQPEYVPESVKEAIDGDVIEVEV